MSLSTILEEIKRLEPYASENVDEGPIQTLSARRGRRAQAISTISRLKEDYVKELHKNAVFVVALGSENQNFASIAKDEYFSFALDPETMFKELSGKIPELLYRGKSSSTSLFDVLGRHIEDMASDLNLAEYNYIIFKGTYVKTLNSKEDLAQLIKTAVTEQMGAEVVGIHALRSIVKDAIQRSHKAPTTTVILPTNDEKFASDLVTNLPKLMGAKVVVVTAGKTPKGSKVAKTGTQIKEVNLETVKEYLKTLKR